MHPSEPKALCNNLVESVELCPLAGGRVCCVFLVNVPVIYQILLECAGHLHLLCFLIFCILDALASGVSLAGVGLPLSSTS